MKFESISDSRRKCQRTTICQDQTSNWPSQNIAMAMRRQYFMELEYSSMTCKRIFDCCGFTGWIWIKGKK